MSLKLPPLLQRPFSRVSDNTAGLIARSLLFVLCVVLAVLLLAAGCWLSGSVIFSFFCMLIKRYVEMLFLVRVSVRVGFFDHGFFGFNPWIVLCLAVVCVV